VTQVESSQSQASSLIEQKSMAAKAEASGAGRGWVPTAKMYLSLHRWNYHQNFAVVCIGALLFDGPVIGAAKLTADLLKLYFSFNICLYSALYVVNAITDREEDAAHPQKRKRPVASGAISVPQAKAYAGALVATGFATGYRFFGAEVCAMYLLFLVLNLTYSYGMRNVKFMRFWFAGLTSPARLHLGQMISGSDVNLACYFLAYFFMTALQSAKIRVEHNKLNSTANGFAPGVVEAISFVGTAIGLYYNYPNNQFVAFVCCFQNFVYIVLPNLSSGAATFWKKVFTADC
jgi:hypothetical protein